MTGMDWVAIIAGVISLATLAVTIPSLVMTRRQEKRATERSIVEWHADEPTYGTVRLTQQGMDTAHDVTVQVWDKHDIAETHLDEVPPDSSGVLELEHRTKNGPDSVSMPTRIMPRLGNAPSSSNIPDVLKGSPFAQNIEKAKQEYATLKAIQDLLDNRDAEFRDEREREQVRIRVSWRSTRGTWATTDVPLSRD
jgi:hypothetical protein